MTPGHRILQSRLQTPVRAYVHSGTRRRITIVTTCHIGEPGYYRDLHATITACTDHGAIVHSEGSDLVSTDTGDLTEAEQAAIAERRRVTELTMSLVAGFGWTHQGTALNDPDWRYIDLPTVEILRRIGVDKMLTRLRAQSQFYSRALREPYLANLAHIILAVSFRLAARTNTRPRPDGHLDAVLLDQRNRVALDAAHATDHDLVLLWGARHLPGLDADLRSRGYLCEREQWHTALTLPSTRTSLVRLLLRRPPAAAPAPAVHDHAEPQ